jgi:hypothetical protein
MGTLSYKKIDYKYQLIQDYFFKLPFTAPDVSLEDCGVKDNNLYADAGFGYDGASGLTVDSENSMEGALVHDIGYRLLRAGLLPSKFKGLFDRLFKIVLKRNGMGYLRRTIWFNAVKRFASYAAEVRPEDIVSISCLGRNYL